MVHFFLSFLLWVRTTFLGLLVSIPQNLGLVLQGLHYAQKELVKVGNAGFFVATDLQNQGG